MGHELQNTNSHEKASKYKYMYKTAIVDVWCGITYNKYIHMCMSTCTNSMYMQL